MKQLILDAYYWALDYAYVAKEQLIGFFGKSHAWDYRNPEGEPVILIPGVYERWNFMRPVAAVLSKHGYDVHAIEGLGYNRGSIEAMADRVEQYIIDNALSGVTIIAHSKGGLIGKYLLSHPVTAALLNGMIALNTPFSGSRYAYLLPVRTLRMFTPSSPILMQLTKDRAVNTRIVSIYGLFDPHIPGGSKLDGAHNVQLPTYGHFRIMNDSRVHGAIVKSLARLKK